METELEELKVQDSFKFSMVLTRFKDVFNQPGLLKDNARVLRSVLDTLKAKVYPCMQGDFCLLYTSAERGRGQAQERR